MPQAMAEQVSRTMSMNDLSDRGDENQRHKRRSLMLIGYVLLGSEIGTAKQIQGGMLDTTFNNKLEELRLNADQYAGSGHLLGLEWQRMKSNPLIWLRENRIVIEGSVKSGPVSIVFAKHKNSGFQIKSGDLIQVAAGSQGRAPRFEVINVPAVYWHTAQGKVHQLGVNRDWSGIEPTALTGAPDVMLSTTFSGCSFCYQKKRRIEYAGHIMPGGDGGKHDKGVIAAAGGGSGGEAMARELAGVSMNVISGNFDDAVTGQDESAAAKFMVYGLRYSNIIGRTNGYDCVLPNQMHILGIRSGAGWKIYSQHNVGGVLSVHEII
jgi:hypothetical protein